MRRLLSRQLFAIIPAFIVELAFSTGVIADDAYIALPYLIRHQPESVQDSWLVVDELIRENESLDRPLPDPYFARGDLWATAGNHEEAVDDYLRATRLLFSGKPTLVEQSRALGRLSDALEGLSKHPIPDYPAEAEQMFWAGVDHFEHRRAKDAEACFKEATRLRPSDPVYRAYRALACRRLGKSGDADRQLAIAASILRKPNYYIWDEKKDFHTRLQRVQGADRRWIHAGLNSPTAEIDLVQSEATRWLKLHQSSTQ